MQFEWRMIKLIAFYDLVWSVSKCDLCVCCAGGSSVCVWERDHLNDLNH